jgi:hypothetical protein
MSAYAWFRLDLGQKGDGVTRSQLTYFMEYSGNERCFLSRRNTFPDYNIDRKQFTNTMIQKQVYNVKNEASLTPCNAMVVLLGHSHNAVYCTYRLILRRVSYTL